MYSRFGCIGILFCATALAGTLSQVNPTTTGQLTSYLNSTTYIDFSGFTEYDYDTGTPTYFTIYDTNLNPGPVTLVTSTVYDSVTYPIDGAKFTIPDTWGPFFAGGGPSYPEGTCTGGFCSQFNGTGTLPVIWHGADNVTIDITGEDVSEFGFEAVPISLSSATITATFYSPDADPLTISYSGLNWETDSRLFAVAGDDISSVTITTDDPYGFGLAAFRYATPEPATCALLGAGLLAFGLMRRRRRA